MNRQRGVALLLVLWVLALLGTLLAGLVGWVHVQNRQALWQRQHLQGQLAAEAGIAMAVLAQLDHDPQRRWRADNQVHALRFDDAELAVSLRSEQGQVDLNAAPAELLARLLRHAARPPGMRGYWRKPSSDVAPMIRHRCEWSRNCASCLA